MSFQAKADLFIFLLRNPKVRPPRKVEMLGSPRVQTVRLQGTASALPQG